MNKYKLGKKSFSKASITEVGNDQGTKHSEKQALKPHLRKLWEPRLPHMSPLLEWEKEKKKYMKQYKNYMKIEIKFALHAKV